MAIFDKSMHNMVDVALKNLTMRSFFFANISVNSTFFPLQRFPSNFTTDLGSYVGLISLTSVTLLLNLLVLVILFKERCLRTAFNVYMISLLSSNIVSAGAACTINMLTDGVRNWLIGNLVCTFYLYNRYVMVPITIHTHVLISLMRAWALFHPMSYRRCYTQRNAWFICFATVLYVHVIIVPGLALDTLYYRLPLEKGCWFNGKAQPRWYALVTYLMFDIPKLTVPVMYPVLFWKRLQRKRATIALARQSRGRAVSAATNSAPQGAHRKSASRPFVLLTLLTFSTVICWTPGLVYYTLLDHFPASRLEILDKIQMTVYPLQALMDPIVFCLSINSLLDYISNKARMVVRKITSGPTNEMVMVNVITGAHTNSS